MKMRAAADEAELSRGVLGIITARGGSKGLPGKNIAPVCGKPLIAWTVEAARASGAIDRLILSTDDQAIAEAARQAGVETPFMRPAHLAADGTPHLPVIQHATQQMEAMGYRPSHIVVLQPTSPLRAPTDIAACLRLAKSSGAASVISVTRFHGHPSWLKRIAADGRLLSWRAEEVTAERRQDDGSAFIPNGAIFVVTAELVRSGRSWYGSEAWAYEMPADRSIDIDNEWDLHLARLILTDRMNPGARSKHA